MTALQDDILPMLNVAKIKHEGTEADDLIGLSCTVLDGHKTVISSDKDMLQLVSSDTQVWAPPIPSRPGMLYTRGNFTKLTGLTPRQYLEMRALTGDGSDNISGVAKGFGEITATELLQKYGSVENLFTKEVEKTLVKRGNRYALLYSEGAREKAYRNLLMMDLKICGQHVNDRDKVVRELRSQIHNRTRINKGLVKRVFLEKKFKSLLETFGTWLIPFERLDSEEA
jgi:5'-3' exonuclease